MNSLKKLNPTTALITGAARRIGAEIARTLHAAGINVIIHHHQSTREAQTLCRQLLHIRPDSAALLQADLLNADASELIHQATTHWGGLNILVNNAALFYPTPVAEATEQQWDALLGCNLKAPFFLSKAAAPWLAKDNGCIINITDIHGQRPLIDHAIYSIAKAALVAMTQSLAKELAPEIRVNAVSPGAILWPETETSVSIKTEILNKIPLQRMGEPADIAAMVLFLAQHAHYISGQVISIDGGRLLFS